MVLPNRYLISLVSQKNGETTILLPQQQFSIFTQDELRGIVYRNIRKNTTCIPNSIKFNQSTTTIEHLDVDRPATILEIVLEY